MAPSGKAQARPVAAAAARELRRAHPDLAIFVRVNGVETEWFEGDVAEALSPELTGVVVPVLEIRRRRGTGGRAAGGDRTARRDGGAGDRGRG